MNVDALRALANAWRTQAAEHPDGLLHGPSLVHCAVELEQCITAINVAAISGGEVDTQKGNDT